MLAHKSPTPSHIESSAADRVNRRAALNYRLPGRQARHLPQLLARGSEIWGERHNNGIHEQIRKAPAWVRPFSRSQRQRIDRIGSAVWCAARQASNNPKLEAGRETAGGKIQVTGKMPIRSKDRSRGAKTAVEAPQRRELFMGRKNRR